MVTGRTLPDIVTEWNYRQNLTELLMFCEVWDVSPDSMLTWWESPWAHNDSTGIVTERRLPYSGGQDFLKLPAKSYEITDFLWCLRRFIRLNPDLIGNSIRAPWLHGDCYRTQAAVWRCTRFREITGKIWPSYCFFWGLRLITRFNAYLIRDSIRATLQHLVRASSCLASCKCGDKLIPASMQHIIDDLFGLVHQHTR